MSTRVRADVPSPKKTFSSLLLLAMLPVAPILAQTPILPPAVIIESADIVPGDLFGYQIDADGSVLLVGAYNDTSAGYAGGALYVFERDGAALAWNQVLEINPATTGRKITGGVVSGDTFAYLESAPDQELHIWERDATGAWQESAVLTDPGYDFRATQNGLALDGDDLFAATVTGPSPRPWKVNHYQRSGGVWQLVDDSLPYEYEDTLFRQPTLRGDIFVYGRRIAERNPATGKFEQVVQLPIPPGADDHLYLNLGATAAISASGTRIAMGARLDDLEGLFSGSVYIYDRDVAGQWNLSARLVPSDAGAWLDFGSAVQFAGERLVVLAGGSSTQNVASRGYLFEPDVTGNLVETLRLEQGGNRLAALDDVAFVGNPFTDGPYAGPGGNVMAYSYAGALTEPVTLSHEEAGHWAIESIVTCGGGVAPA